MLLFCENFLCTHPGKGLFSEDSALDSNFFDLYYIRLTLHGMVLTEGRHLYVHLLEVHFQLVSFCSSCFTTHSRQPFFIFLVLICCLMDITCDL